MTLLAFAEIAGERLSDEDAGTYFELLVTAGIETTGSAISHGVIALCNDAEQRLRWQADFDALAKSAIEEIIRWATPVVHFRRTATAATTLRGQRIQAGDKVVVFYNSANRDEDVFDTPHKFDISRQLNPHVGFGGGGPHTCLGAHLARLEIRAFFATLLPAFPELELDGPPVLMHSMFFNGVKSAPCRFSPTAAQTGVSARPWTGERRRAMGCRGACCSGRVRRRTGGHQSGHVHAPSARRA